jgi:hypothetical protein
MPEIHLFRGEFATHLTLAMPVLGDTSLFTTSLTPFVVWLMPFPIAVRHFQPQLAQS